MSLPPYNVVIPKEFIDFLQDRASVVLGDDLIKERRIDSYDRVQQLIIGASPDNHYTVDVPYDCLRTFLQFLNYVKDSAARPNRPVQPFDAWSHIILDAGRIHLATNIVEFIGGIE